MKYLFILKLQMEMLFCSTVVGLPFLIPPMLLTGELFEAWTSCSQVNAEVYSPQKGLPIIIFLQMIHVDFTD